MRFIYTKTFGVFFVCLFFIVLIVFLNSSGKIFWLKKTLLLAPKPIAKGVSILVKPVKTFFFTLYRLKEINRENNALRAKIMALQQILVDFERIKIENELLGKELGFFRSNKYNLAPCRTLSEKVFGFSDAISVDCGTESGVEEGQAVISNGFLVGKILRPEKSLSTVLLATSSKFLTDARLSKTNVPGVVSGSFNSGLFFDQLPVTANIESGWLVVTAGINEKIPRNIPIGEVGTMISGQNDLFKKTTLTSPIDFKNLEFVFVVK